MHIAPDGHALRHISSPAASKLAEMILIHCDLKNVLNICYIIIERYSETEKENSEDTLVGLSLFRDCVVQFIACFGSNPQKHLDKNSVYQEEHPSFLEFFQIVLDIRDTYAAHNFGPLRQCIVGAVSIPREPGAEPVFVVGHVAMVPSVPERDWMMDFVKLVEIAERFADQSIRILSDEVFDTIKSTPCEEIMALPDVLLSNPDGSLRMTRERFSGNLSRKNKRQ